MESAEFHTCEKWLSENTKLAEHLTKGQPVTINGRLVTKTWTNEAGEKRERKVIRVDQIDLQGKA